MTSQATPGIAAIGVIGINNNPLHISMFPPGQRDSLEFQFLLNSSLDIFEARLPHQAADHDFGLLQAIDECLAMYGWVTNTGVKIVIIVDLEGKPPNPNVNRSSAILGIRDSDLKPAFRAIQTAYIRLLHNPFYYPDDHNPRSQIAQLRVGSLQILSPRFIKEMARIGETWHPGIQAI